MKWVYSPSIERTHTQVVHEGDKLPVKTGPAEAFPFSQISGSIDRVGLNCKAWLCTPLGTTILSGDSTHTHLGCGGIEGDCGRVKGKQERRGEGGTTEINRKDRGAETGKETRSHLG